MPDVRCPRCGSTSLSAVTRGYGSGKGAVGCLLVGPLGLLAGGIGANKTLVTCLACGHRWKPGRVRAPTGKAGWISVGVVIGLLMLAMAVSTNRDRQQDARPIAPGIAPKQMKPTGEAAATDRQAAMPPPLVEPPAEPEPPAESTPATVSPDASAQPPAVEQPPEKPTPIPSRNRPFRTWTDSTGTHTIDAQFMGAAFGEAKLRKRDGSEVTLPLERLSEADQAWIKGKR